MVEELRRRLDFGNNSVRMQTVNRIYLQILEKKKNAKIDKIASPVIEIPELQLLWDKCIDGNATVSSGCSQAVFTLVQAGHAEYNYVLNNLLNLIPSAKCLTAALRTISNLLLLQVSVTLQHSQTADYKCPYDIRTPPHPLISVLTSRSDSYPVLVDQVQYLLSNDSEQLVVCCIKLLEPFLKFVLMDPNVTSQHGSLKTSLYTTLLQLCTSRMTSKQDDDDSVQCLVEFLVNVTPSMQIEPLTSMTETLTCLSTLTNFLILYPEMFSGYLSTLAINLLCLCKKLLAIDGDPRSSLHLVSRISQVVVLPEVMVSMLSHMMLSLPIVYMQNVLLICKNLLLKSCQSHVNTMLVLPVLQVISVSQSSVVIDTRLKNAIQSLASEVVMTIENGKKSEEKPSKKESYSCIDAWNQIASTCTQYAIQFQEDLKTAFHWLVTIQSELKKGDHVPDDVILLLGYLLLKSEQPLVEKCLTVLTDVAAKDVTKAPCFLSLLLYKLGKEIDPDIRLKILYTIPLTATHKVCVGPVLKTLQTFGVATSMSAIVVRLITALWKLQDRCFPHLQKLLTLTLKKTKSESDLIDDVLLAKAVSVRDVCRERPFQHGSDMLTAIQWFIFECQSVNDESVVALALEGLYFLCQSEFVDIRTTWREFSSKFTKEERPLVNKKLCELFSLVPDLNVETEDYEEFRDDIVTILWSFAKNANPVISGAAFAALSQFDEEEFRLDDLPDDISRDVKAKAAAAKEREKAKRQDEDDEDDDDDDEDLDIPGDCYLNLLTQISPYCLQDFEKFLTSLIAQEMNNMPRGVYHSALKGQRKSANQSKALSGIPALMQRQYDRNKLPGLKQGLAAALLFCYDPPLEVGRDGKPARRHVVGLGRAYQQTLNIMLNEVPVQPSDWFRTVLMPHTWTTFMSRLFDAMFEGRKAELEMQLSHKQIDITEDEMKMKQKTAWLWVRDKITDLLKSASKGNPSVQSNSILAFASLAVYITKYTSSLGQTEVDNAIKLAPEHIGQGQWLNKVTDTLLCILDDKFKPKGRIFNMCQQRASGHNNIITASTLARATTAIALPQLVPILITTNTETVYKMMSILSTGLPGQQKEDISPVIQFHHGAGLGMVLSQLYQEHFSDVTGSEGTMATMKALDALERSCLSPGVENNNGSLLGLGLALSSLCGLGATASRVHVTSTHVKLMTLLEAWEEAEKSGIAIQTLCMCLAWVTVSACNSHYLSPDIAAFVLQKFQSLCEKYPQVSGIALSCGVLCCGLSAAGHTASNTVIENLFSQWIEQATTPEVSHLEQTAMLHGLVGLVSMETTFVYVNTEIIMSSEMQTRQNKVVKSLSQVLTSSDDIGMRNSAAWLLAYLYMMSTTSKQSKSSVPSNYAYLPETSVLRATIDFLITAGKQGPETITPSMVEVAMESLIKNSKGVTLPPVNLAAILSPLPRMKYGVEVHHKCLKLAVNQCQGSSSASLFLQSWLTTSLFNSLQEKCRDILYLSLHVLLKGLPMSKMKPFIETSLREPFSVATQDNTALCTSVLRGLLEALKLPDPPQSATLLLYQTVDKIYHMIPGTIQKYQIPVLAALGDCLVFLPLDVVDRITKPDDKENLLKATFIRCYIFSKGHQPITWLNPCIDAAIATNQPDCHQIVVWLLTTAFLNCRSVQTEQMGVLPRVQWMLELLGHIKNTAAKKISLKEENLQLTLKFMVDVLAIAVVSWSGTNLALSLGLMSSHSPAFHLSQKLLKEEVDLKTSLRSGLQDMCIGMGGLEKLSMLEIAHLLPTALPVLLSIQPWCQMTDKMVDWLIVMLEVPNSDMLASTRLILKESLHALRHLPEFRKTSNWTRAFSKKSYY
ncbi:focadhesin-like [Glandiceps talaboti]